MFAELEGAPSAKDFSVTKKLNPKHEQKIKFLNKKPMLKVEDRNLDLRERLHKSIKYESK
jgi:hypothetical protein